MVASSEGTLLHIIAKQRHNGQFQPGRIFGADGANDFAYPLDSCSPPRVNTLYSTDKCGKRLSTQGKICQSDL